MQTTSVLYDSSNHVLSVCTSICTSPRCLPLYNLPSCNTNLTRALNLIPVHKFQPDVADLTLESSLWIRCAAWDRPCVPPKFHYGTELHAAKHKQVAHQLNKCRTQPFWIRRCIRYTSLCRWLCLATDGSLKISLQWLLLGYLHEIPWQIANKKPRIH